MPTMIPSPLTFATIAVGIYAVVWIGSSLVGMVLCPTPDRIAGRECEERDPSPTGPVTDRTWYLNEPETGRFERYLGRGDRS